LIEEDRNICISPIGEFVDKNLEKEFFNADINNALKYIKPLMLAFGILYFLFIIPDYVLIKDLKTFRLILLNRSMFVILGIIFYFRLNSFMNYRVFILWITGYELFFILSFLLIVYQYESPNFLIQSLGVVIIVMGIFLIPNRWINIVIVSITLCTAFLVLSLYILDPLTMREFYAALVYILIAIVLNSISSWRLNYYKRIQHLISQNLTLLSTTDSLTHIYNRLKFDEELQKSINYCSRYNTNLSLILFDIDDFKTINDSYGHLTGDNVLIDLSTMVKNLIRKTDTFARWGGEEFVILLPNTGLNRAREVAQKIKAKIDNYSFNNIMHITCSFGVTSYCGEEDLRSLIHRIDKLLYEAKKAGKNTIVSDLDTEILFEEQRDNNGSLTPCP